MDDLPSAAIRDTVSYAPVSSRWSALVWASNCRKDTGVLPPSFERIVPSRSNKSLSATTRRSPTAKESDLTSPPVSQQPGRERPWRASNLDSGQPFPTSLLASDGNVQDRGMQPRRSARCLTRDGGRMAGFRAGTVTPAVTQQQTRARTQPCNRKQQHPSYSRARARRQTGG